MPRSNIMTRSGSTGTIARPKAPPALQEPAKERGMQRSASLAGGLASQIKSAVAGGGSHAQGGSRRPAAHAVVGRRRPAPKVITDNAVQLRTPAPAELGTEGAGKEATPDSYRSLPTPSKFCSGSPGSAGKEMRPDSHRSLPTPSTCYSSSPSSASGSMKGRHPGPFGFGATTPSSSTIGLPSGAGSQCCSVQMAEGDGANTEIRTKVFRMGAPLLRSTIPLSMNAVRPTSAAGCVGGSDPQKEERAERSTEDDDGDDAESVLSSSELGVDDIGALNVTLDFPC